MSNELDGIDVTVNVDPVSLTVNGDRALLEQVLINIVQNAIDALSDTTDKALTLEARLSYGKVCIEICDNGPGIDAETMPQVFVPFFTTRRQGSGIGLSLCRQIMSAHGGEIVLANAERGTCVTLRF